MLLVPVPDLTLKSSYFHFLSLLEFLGLSNTPMTQSTRGKTENSCTLLWRALLASFLSAFSFQSEAENISCLEAKHHVFPNRRSVLSFPLPTMGVIDNAPKCTYDAEAAVASSSFKNTFLPSWGKKTFFSTLLGSVTQDSEFS